LDTFEIVHQRLGLAVEDHRPTHSTEKNTFCTIKKEVKKERRKRLQEREFEKKMNSSYILFYALLGLMYTTMLRERY